MPFQLSINIRLLYTLLFYILFVIIIIAVKPRFLFDEEGNIIAFGVGKNKTIFSLGTLILAFALVCFYLFAVIDLIFQKNKLSI